MHVKIVNVSSTDYARVKRFGQADADLAPGQSLVVADDSVMVEDATAQAQQPAAAKPVAKHQAPVVQEGPQQIDRSRLINADTLREDMRKHYIAQGVPAEDIKKAFAPRVLPDGFVAGSAAGGPGFPVDPVDPASKPPEKNNGITTSWDPNGGNAMVPGARKHMLINDFG